MDIFVRVYVADNPKTPRSVLVKLAKDSEYFVRNAAIQKLIKKLSK